MSEARAGNVSGPGRFHVAEILVRQSAFASGRIAYAPDPNSLTI
jgi:hypothetical protein